jgi:hypothetical protein
MALLAVRLLHSYRACESVKPARTAPLRRHQTDE